MFFDNWQDIIRIFVAGTIVYIFLIFWLRVTGKRTLSRWNAFDSIVTFALGSTLASVILSKDVSVTEGILGLFLLVLLQFIITWLTVRFDFVKHLVKAEPTLLFKNGEFLQKAMRRQRVPEAEIRAAIRKSGISATEDVEAVVLETDGRFSVIKKSDGNSKTALEDVAGFDKNNY